MADLRVDQTATNQQRPAPVSGEGAGNRERQQGRERSTRPRPGAEELAVALSEADRTELTAHYEPSEDGDGDGLIHIVDNKTGETVAILTPEELRAMAETTGLPAGLLVEVAS